MALFPSTIILIVVVLAGLVALGIGGYALYSLLNKDSESIFVDGSNSTIAVLGIIALLVGLGVFCCLVAIIGYGFFGFNII